MANLGDEIKEYITKLTSTSIGNNNALANIQDIMHTKDCKIKAMVAQLKSLTNTVTLPAKSEKPADKNHDPNHRCSHGP